MRAFRPRLSNMLDGYTAETIAAWCGVHVTTARRWKRGEEPSVSAQKIFELMSTGNLEVIDPHWTGWRLHGGKLFPPGDKSGLSPGEVMATEYWRALARSYQADMRIGLQADWVSEAWVPVREIESA